MTWTYRSVYTCSSPHPTPHIQNTIQKTMTNLARRGALPRDGGRVGRMELRQQSDTLLVSASPPILLPPPIRVGGHRAQCSARHVAVTSAKSCCLPPSATHVHARCEIENDRRAWVRGSCTVCSPVSSVKSVN